MRPPRGLSTASMFLLLAVAALAVVSVPGRSLPYSPVGGAPAAKDMARTGSERALSYDSHVPTGSRTWASAHLDVNPGPTILTFTASANGVPVGTPVWLNVVATGGTRPLEIGFSGLPPGCRDANLSSLPCTPTVAGAFLVTATVSDAVGRTATAELHLRVLAVGGPVGAPSHPGRTSLSPTPVVGQPSRSSFSFEDGLAVGLATLVLVGAWVARRRRLDDQASELVESLEAASPEQGPSRRSEEGEND